MKDYILPLIKLYSFLLICFFVVSCSGSDTDNLDIMDFNEIQILRDAVQKDSIKIDSIHVDTI